MELSTAHLEELHLRGLDGGGLERTLRNEHPDAELSILCGYDEFSGTRYIIDAYFSIARMRLEIGIRNSHLPGGTRAIYEVLTCTPRQLRDGEVADAKTALPLDTLEIDVAYEYLAKNLGEVVH